jgi:hypothetical protein
VRDRANQQRAIRETMAERLLELLQIGLHSE